MGSKDAAVDIDDLVRAEGEIGKRGPDEATRRMRELEPILVQYIEASADQLAGRLANTATLKIEDIRGVALEMRKIAFVAMRAQQLGYYRLWKNAFLDDPPLSQLNESSPESDPQDGPAKR